MDDAGSQRPSIRLRRSPSSPSINTISSVPEDEGSGAGLQVPGAEGSGGGWGRPRASSAASRLGKRISGYLPRVEEGSSSSPADDERRERRQSAAGAVPVNKPLPDLPENARVADGGTEYESNLVDFLDLIGMFNF